MARLVCEFLCCIILLLALDCELSSCSKPPSVSYHRYCLPFVCSVVNPSLKFFIRVNLRASESFNNHPIFERFRNTLVLPVNYKSRTFVLKSDYPWVIRIRFHFCKSLSASLSVSLIFKFVPVSEVK